MKIEGKLSLWKDMVLIRMEMAENIFSIIKFLVTSYIIFFSKVIAKAYILFE